MKIYECEIQLKRIVDRYNKLSEINSRITDQFPYITDNFDVDRFVKILDQICASFTIIPINLSEQIESYFNNFTDEINDEIAFIEDNIKTFNNIFKDTDVNNFATRSLARLKYIKEEENIISKLISLLNFISSYINREIKFGDHRTKSINLKNIMENAVLPSRKIIVDYIFSLEVPAIPDYDL